MERAKNIESLSLCFTLGVGLGTVLLKNAGIWLPAVLLPLLCLPVLFREQLGRCRREALAVGTMLAAFLLLGIFCARNAALPGAAPDNPLKELAENAAGKLKALIDAIPFRDGTTAPLLKAFLTGDRSALPGGVREAFRGSGASHLLALSGLHMGILYMLLDVATKPFGGSPAARILRFSVLVPAAGFFTIMTGSGPSIVRAFLFISLNETLRLLNRPRKATRVLCVALLLQLVMDPGVITSLGFQLSYLAMAGIFLLYPLLEAIYPPGSRWNPFRRLWNSAALAISCQAFTAPLAWMRFHSFPMYFLLTNILAIPLTTALMSIAVGTVALSAAGICPPALVQATDALCRTLVWVLETIAAM